MFGGVEEIKLQCDSNKISQRTHRELKTAIQR